MYYQLPFRDGINTIVHVGLKLIFLFVRVTLGCFPTAIYLLRVKHTHVDFPYYSLVTAPQKQPGILIFWKIK